jgi:hypothetical protein
MPKLGLAWEPWERCGRCRQKRHASELTKQDGMLVCATRGTCFDNKENERRERQIAEIVATPEGQDESLTELERGEEELHFG